MVADTAERTEGGTVTVERARAAFEAIGTAVDEVTGRAADIAGAVEALSADADQIARGRRRRRHRRRVGQRVERAGLGLDAADQRLDAGDRRVRAGARRQRRGARAARRDVPPRLRTSSTAGRAMSPRPAGDLMVGRPGAVSTGRAPHWVRDTPIFTWGLSLPTPSSMLGDRAHDAGRGLSSSSEWRGEALVPVRAPSAARLAASVSWPASVSVTITWRRSVSRAAARRSIAVVLELVEHRGHRGGGELGALGQRAGGDPRSSSSWNSARTWRAESSPVRAGSRPRRRRSAPISSPNAARSSSSSCDGHAATASSASSAGSARRRVRARRSISGQHDRRQQRDDADARAPTSRCRRTRRRSPAGVVCEAGDAALQDDGEDRGADRAADALQHVQLRRGVVDLVGAQDGVGGGHRRHHRHADAEAADDHRGGDQPERRVGARSGRTGAWRRS